MSPAGMVEGYSDGLASFYERVIAGRALRLSSAILERSGLAAELASGPPRSVLDVGCGGGQALLRLKQQQPRHTLNGVDLSPVMIARARSHAAEAGCAIHYAVANAQELPFADAQFDVVVSFGSAKHWPDPLQGIGECWRVLKPGGDLLLFDNTSDSTPAQVANFFRVAGFPGALEWAAVPLIDRRMFRTAQPMRVYENIASDLHLPPGAVTHPPDLPVFVFRTRKPA